MAIARTRAERGVRFFRAWPERFTAARYWLLGLWLMEIGFRAMAWDWR
jgi:hypothetical protein